MKIILSIDGLSYKNLDLSIMPNIKKLIEESMYIKKVNTIFPSVTWKIHSVVSTGEVDCGVVGNQFINNEGVLKNYWDDDVLNQVLTKSTFYDSFFLEGLKVASICWPLTQGSNSIKYNIPEFYSQEEFDRSCTTLFFEELLQANIPVNQYGRYSTVDDLVILQDELTNQIIEYIITNKDVDVIMGHYLSIDTFEHCFGVDSKEVKFAMKFIDGQIGKIIQKLKAMNLYDQSQILIFSDHGQVNIEETIDLPKELKKANLDSFVRFCDDGGAIHFYSDECNEKLEQFIKSASYFISYKNVDPKNNNGLIFIASFKKGYVTSDYGSHHPFGATHGYDPKYVDEMNTFALYKGSSKGVIEEMKIQDLIELLESKGK